MSEYFWLIPFFPAIGVILNGIFGIKYFSKKIVHTIACSTVFLSFLLAGISFFSLLGLPPDERFWRYELFTWIPGGVTHLFNGLQAIFNVSASFQFDPLSAVMALVVSGV
ncbi:MAG: NADH-quinone oxidoreductase subunit L, partial [Candidatus Aminicenantia bacterium]